MKSIKLFTNLVKNSALKKSFRAFNYPLIFNSRLGLSMTPKFYFSSSKESPNDYSKNKVQGKQMGEQYESIQLKTACLGLFSYVIISGN